MKKRANITESAIVEASWALLGEDGIEKFSMRRLAERLGIQAPSIYWYFKSKQSLFQILSNEVAKDILRSAKTEGDWKQQLYHLSFTIRDKLRAYPCSAQLMMKTLPSEPDYIRLINTMLRAVDETSMPEKDKFHSIVCLHNYVISFVLDESEQQQVVNALSSEEGHETETGHSFRQSLERMPLDEVDVIKRMFDHGAIEEQGSDPMFQSGLNIILLGMEQLMGQHKESRASL